MTQSSVEKPGRLALAIGMMAFLVASFLWTPVSIAKKRVPSSQIEIKQSFAPVVKQTAPGVVNIYIRRVSDQRRNTRLLNDPIFRHFFGREFGFGMPRRRAQSSLGSGVIVTEEGIVVTNHHVIKGAKDSEIKVALADKREFSAKVILRDKKTDLAVLQLEGGENQFPYIDFADSDSLEVGDLVLAIGNPFNVGQTVTSGIVSALARSTRIGRSDYQSYIQTDAAINPGNSGGALVDIDGHLVGINTAIRSEGGGSDGIGFAVPSNMVRLVVNAALTGSQVVRPWLGAKLQPVTSDIARALKLEAPTGAMVRSLHPGSPAARAGLKPSDVIVAVDGRKVIDPRGFNYRFSTKGVGSDTQIDYVRNKQMRRTSIRLVAAPETPPRNIQELQGRHPFDGVTVANLSPAFSEEFSLQDTEGVILYKVPWRTFANQEGLRARDIIQSVNGIKIHTARQLKNELREARGVWHIELKRGNRTFDRSWRL